MMDHKFLIMLSTSDHLNDLNWNNNTYCFICYVNKFICLNTYLIQLYIFIYIYLYIIY